MGREVARRGLYCGFPIGAAGLSPKRSTRMRRPFRLFGALSRLAARAAVMPPERGILGAPGMAAPRTSLRLFENVIARALPVAAAVRTLLAVAMSGACLAVARGAITPGAIVRRART